MGHRVFIAINFPEDVKEELGNIRDEFPILPCRWTRKENLHLTLLFLGYLNDEEVLETCRIVKAVGERHSPFVFELNEISYGPPGKKLPRMVWVNGKPVKELTKLNQQVHHLQFHYDTNSHFGQEDSLLVRPALPSHGFLLILYLLDG